MRRERLIYHLEICGQIVVMLLPPMVLDSKFLFCNNLYKYIHIGRLICVYICVYTHMYTEGFPDGSVGRESVLPSIQETQEAQVRSLGQEDPLEEGMAAHSRILAWRIPWTEEPGGLQSTGTQSQI